MDGYGHLVKIQLGETTLKVPVIFVEKPIIPHVLGREGVFPLFGILFDEGKRKVGFLDGEKDRPLIDSVL
jgi:hypothetical protein